MKAISLVHFLVVLFIIDVVWCERKKSSTTCSPEQCVQGFNPLDCPDGTVYQEKVAMEGCCPGCVRFRGTPSLYIYLAGPCAIDATSSFVQSYVDFPL